LVWEPGVHAVLDQKRLDSAKKTYCDTPCPVCSSKKTVEMLNQNNECSGKCYCRTCGTQFSILREGDSTTGEEEEESTERDVCPHCQSVDSIDVGGGFDEWCIVCNLDPAEVDIPGPSIGHLYKGAARKLLLRDSPIVRADRPYGQFLRYECGPHCTYSDQCLQELGNLRRCSLEDVLDFEHQESGVMSKRRGKRGKRKKKDWNTRKQTYNAGPPKVTFFCAKGGLLEKMYGPDNSNPEQPGNSGAESGA
jgi:hypothetical protein